MQEPHFGIHKEIDIEGDVVRAVNAAYSELAFDEHSILYECTMHHTDIAGIFRDGCLRNKQGREQF